jgi:hypothetical protein
MEEDGVVGPHQGYKAREILVDQIEETTDSSVQEA